MFHFQIKYASTDLLINIPQKKPVGRYAELLPEVE